MPGTTFMLTFLFNYVIIWRNRIQGSLRMMTSCSSLPLETWGKLTLSTDIISMKMCGRQDGLLILNNCILHWRPANRNRIDWQINWLTHCKLASVKSYGGHCLESSKTPRVYMRLCKHEKVLYCLNCNSTKRDCRMIAIICFFFIRDISRTWWKTRIRNKQSSLVFHEYV